MSLESVLDSYVEITSNYVQERPDSVPQEFSIKELSREELDNVLEYIISLKNEFNSETLGKLYTLYTNLRESRSIDHYMYLYFPDNIEENGVETIADYFSLAIDDVNDLILGDNNERLEFMENMKKRIENIKTIRELLNNYSQVKIEDDKRYINVEILEKRMHDKLDLDILYIREPDSDYFFKGKEERVQRWYLFNKEMISDVVLEGWDD